MASNFETLLAGEKALDNAPKTELADGRFCIPQHYLSYQHTLQSVEQLLLDIDFDPRYPVFVSQDDPSENSSIYIQVGIIGTDNYKASTDSNVQSQSKQEKVVYGRKWRIEPQLPTSEIIQTVFLALKKAREHEVRELFRIELQNKITTPFNNHHDLPLLTNSRERLQAKPDTSEKQNQALLFKCEIERILSTLRYGGVKFELMNFIPRPTKEYLVDLRVIHGDDQSLIELKATKFISIFISELNINYLLHSLMQQMIQFSDRYVDESFYYRGFNRFSWDNSIKAIAELSSEVRQLHKSKEAQDFALNWQKNNYETDRSRIPVVTSGKLWHKLKIQLEPFSPIESTLPIRSY